jgi:phospholipase C
MSGFVKQALSMSPNLLETVMKGFRPESVPVYAALICEFAIFDRWFSSIPGPTQPNRLFVYSATSHGSTSHVKKQLALGYPQKTIFYSLHENGMNFGIYFQNIPTTLFYRNMRKLKYISKFHQYDLKFKKDARNGKLPSLTVIKPRYFDLKGMSANNDHPSHDVANGQKLVKEVYETLRASPQWNETLLVITYDEYGGFYDHVETRGRRREKHWMVGGGIIGCRPKVATPIWVGAGITKTTMVLMGCWGGGIAETTWEGIFVTWPYQNYVVLMFQSTFTTKTN